MQDFKVEILKEKFSEDKNDPLWYYGEDIARIQFMNGKKLYAESRGELQVQFEENGTRFKGDNVVTEACNLNLTDKDIELLSQNDLVIFSNWFAIIMVDINGECCSDDLGIAGSYDEAIEMLKEIAPIEYAEMYT